MYKIWQGRQLLAQTIWMQSEYLLESLNFAAFTKPNKHKTDSKDFSTTWPNLFSKTFTTVGEFKRLLQSFFANRFSRHDGTVLPVPVTSTSTRSSSPPTPTRVFWYDKSLHTPLPARSFVLSARSRQISARKWKVPGKYLKRFSETPRLKLSVEEGFCERFVVSKNACGRGREALARAGWRYWYR